MFSCCQIVKSLLCWFKVQPLLRLTKLIKLDLISKIRFALTF